MKAAAIFFLSAAPVLACKCIAAYPVCNEVQHSDRVFIGTVVSVIPAILDPWSRVSPEGLHLPAAEIATLQKDPSPAAFARLKTLYLEILRDTAADSRKRLAAAANHAELERAFEAITSRGRMTRFHVGKAWKSEAKDDDDDDQFIDIWSDAGDCGVPFQKGESWLVYADEDEETSTLETSVCTRTRLLTEAGSDLAYLFHYEATPKAATRLEGFVSNTIADQFHGWVPEPMAAPVSGVTVKLNNLYATTAADGSYTFDGLPAGEYTLSVLAAGFPETFRVISGPQTLQLEERSCARQILIVPK